MAETAEQINECKYSGNAFNTTINTSKLKEIFLTAD